VLALPIFSELSEPQQVEVVDALTSAQLAVGSSQTSAVSSSQSSQ
jgi:hypothetical protein